MRQIFFRFFTSLILFTFCSQHAASAVPLPSFFPASTQISNSQFKILDSSPNVEKKLSIQIAQQQIDRSLEKSKMNGFLQSVLSTVSNAGLQGMSSSLLDASGLRLQASGDLEARGIRGPPAGLAGFFERARSAFGGVVQTLKNTAGRIKSIFISARGGSAALFGGRDSSSGLPSAYDEFIDEYSQIDFDSEDNPYYKPLDLGAQIQYGRSSARDGVSFFDMDEGTRQVLRLDPNTKNVLSSERVGLPAGGSVAGNLKPSFVQSLRDFATDSIDFIDAATNPLINRLGGPYFGGAGTTIFLGREYVKALVDTLRLGDQFSAIQSDFQSGLDLFRQGDYLNSARSFGSAGLRGLTEVGRFANFLPLAGLATKGVGRLGKIADVLTDQRGFVRIGREASKLKFGPDDLLYGIYNKRLDKLQQSAGGVKLIDIIEDKFGGIRNLPPGMTNVIDFSKHILDRAASSGRMVRFDITGVTNLKGVLKGAHYPNAITSQELRYIHSNWERFKHVVRFYKNGKEVKKPW